MWKYKTYSVSEHFRLVILTKAYKHVHKAGEKVKFNTINYKFKVKNKKKTPSPKAQQQLQENTRNGTELSTKVISK